MEPSNPPSEEFVCHICGESFHTSQNLKEHVHYHKKRLACCICNKTFSSKSNLNRHRRGHTGKLAYACHVCECRYSCSSELRVHVRRHTGERPYACSLCKKRFFTTGNLRAHERSHTGKRPYACNDCERRFLNSRDLSIHIRSHTGEQPYACSLCKKRFSTSSNLRAHERRHTRERPHAENHPICDSCGKEYKKKAFLQMHLQRCAGKNKIVTIAEKNLPESGTVDRLPVSREAETGQEKDRLLSSDSEPILEERFGISSDLNAPSNRLSSKGITSYLRSRHRVHLFSESSMHISGGSTTTETARDKPPEVNTAECDSVCFRPSASGIAGQDSVAMSRDELSQELGDAGGLQSQPLDLSVVRVDEDTTREPRPLRPRNSVRRLYCFRCDVHLSDDESYYSHHDQH